jgi:hypothetical protein
MLHRSYQTLGELLFRDISREAQLVCTCPSRRPQVLHMHNCTHQQCPCPKSSAEYTGPFHKANSCKFNAKLEHGWFDTKCRRRTPGSAIASPSGVVDSLSTVTPPCPSFLTPPSGKRGVLVTYCRNEQRSSWGISSSTSRNHVICAESSLYPYPGLMAATRSASSQLTVSPHTCN